MDIISTLAKELEVGRGQVEAAVRLIDEGNTIPFIARYRKEATGALNDEILRNLDERLKYLRGLDERREQVLRSIEEQGKLTEELKNKLLEAKTMVAVELWITAVTNVPVSTPTSTLPVTFSSTRFSAAPELFFRPSPMTSMP